MGKGKALKGFFKPLLQGRLRTVARPAGRRASSAARRGTPPPSAQRVMDRSLRNQRRELDRAERRARNDRLDARAREEGLDSRRDLPRANPPYTMDASTHMARARNNGASRREIARQRNAYRDGMNGQTVDETLARIDNPPTRPSTTQARNNARDSLAQRAQMDLVDAGYSPRQAREWARQYADEVFPRGSGHMPEQMLHNPDMHLGGRTQTVTHGDGRVNNAFGRMAVAERDDFAEYLREQQRRGNGGALLNIEVII